MLVVVDLLLHNSTGRRSFVEIKSDNMHVVRKMYGTNGFAVGFHELEFMDEQLIGERFVEVFRSPKQAVAMAVCNLLNGGPAELHDNICMVNDFLKADAAKLYNTNEYL